MLSICLGNMVQQKMSEQVFGIIASGLNNSPWVITLKICIGVLIHITQKVVNIVRDQFSEFFLGFCSNKL